MREVICPRCGEGSPGVQQVGEIAICIDCGIGGKPCNHEHFDSAMIQNEGVAPTPPQLMQAMIQREAALDAAVTTDLDDLLGLNEF